MLILTPENRSYDLNKVPSEVEDLRYCVLDCSNKKDIDYYYLPLVFLESYTSPAIVLEIGDKIVQMPLDWSILVCDEDYSTIEIMSLTKLDERGLHTLVYNPFKHMFPVPAEVNVVNVFAEVKWYFPKLKNGHVLVVPIEEGDTPKCVLFVKDLSKLPDSIDVAELFQ